MARRQSHITQTLHISMFHAALLARVSISKCLYFDHELNLIKKATSNTLSALHILQTRVVCVIFFFSKCIQTGSVGVRIPLVIICHYFLCSWFNEGMMFDICLVFAMLLLTRNRGRNGDYKEFYLIFFARSFAISRNCAHRKTYTKSLI